MVRTLSAKQAQVRFATLVGELRSRKGAVIVQEQGKPVVAVIDFDRYQALVEGRDRRFRVLDRIWRRNRDKDPRRVYRDATQAVAEVRAARRSRKGARA